MNDIAEMTELKIVKKSSANALFRSAILHYFSVILLCLFFSNACGQNLRFQKLTMEDGLSNDRHWSKNCILKDNFGIVWISTIDGFNRWDGYDVEVFKNDIFDTTSIHSNFVVGIDQAIDGDIYIGTADKGIAKYDYETGVFTDLGLHKLIEGSIAVHTLHCDSIGNVWMGVGRSGLYKYSIEKDSFEKILMFKQNSKFHNYESIINAITLKDGTILFSSHIGLHFYNKEQDSFRFISTSPFSFETLEEASDGKIWGSDRGFKDVLIVDPQGSTMDTLIVIGQTNHNVTSIRKDHENNMWMGKGDVPQIHLSKYDIQTKEFSYFNHDPLDPLSFCNGAANALTIDSLGRMWYMSSSKGAGYTRIEEPYFEKLLDYPVNNIHFKNDSIIILPSEGNFQSFNIRTLEVEVIYPKNQSIAFRPSLLDTDQNLWFFSNSEEGLFKFNLETNQLENIPAIYAGGLAEQEDIIWTSNSLNFVDKNTMTYYSMNDILKSKGHKPIPEGFNYDIKVLHDEDILMTSANDGIYLYHSKDTSYTHYDGLNFEIGKLSSPSVLKFKESEFSNTIYLATNENINIWNRDTDTFSYVNRSDGLKGRPLSMIEDEDGHLWSLTTMGIFKIIDNKVVASYGQEFGLTGMADRIDPKMERDKNGFIYFSTSNAFYRFHPYRLKATPPPQDILIQHLFLDRKKQKPSTSTILTKNLLLKPKLSVSYNNRDLGFGYVSPFGKNRNIQYHYRLLGYNDDWVNNSENREVHFTGLNGGSYTLQVKGQASDGMWTKVSEYPFEVNSPWYATWYAYLCYFLLISLGAYSFYRYRINQILMYQKLRTRISSDLHDDVGSLLSSLAWQTDVISMTADEKIKSKYDKISQLSRDAMERMRDTVWAIDSRKDNMGSLIDRMKDFLSDALESHQLNFKIDHEDMKEGFKIAPDVRQNVYLIFKEAVTNAIKYTNGSMIDIHISQRNNRLYLKVKDNGSIDKETIKTSGLGISNMEMRAKRINADFSINWENGCEIRLEV